jgi:uncharacterized protein (DUF427 family)
MAQRRRHVIQTLTYEPVPRRVRGWLGVPHAGGRAVVDSRRPLLVWEPHRFLPCYAFPATDVDRALLSPSALPGPDAHGPDVTFYDLQTPGGVRRHAAWSWSDPQLDGAIAFDWEALDHWYDEDDEVYGHPRDPYHRIDVLPGERHVRVELGGQLVAETRRPLIMLETLLPVRYYFAPGEVQTGWLAPSDLRTVCPYKGFCRYWRLRLPGREPGGRELAWNYPKPFAGLEQIAARIAFLDEALDVIVDGQLQPRPRTQWTAGILANSRGGGSGLAQGAHAGSDGSVLAAAAPGAEA